YEVGGGQQQALHVGLLSDDDPETMTAPRLMKHVRLLQQRAPLPADLAAPVQRALQTYADRFTRPTAALVPVAAAACLGWFAERGPLLALSADKGVTRPELIDDGEALPVTVHGGSVSMTVDFWILSQMLAEKGGWSRSGDPGSPLFVHHLDVIGLDPADLPGAIMTFDQAFQSGQGYALYRLSKTIVEEKMLPSPERLATLLQLTRWDPDVLWTFSEAFQKHLYEGNITEPLQAELQRSMRAVGDRVYTVSQDRNDVDAILAELLASLSDPAGAEVAWTRSINHRGATPQTLHGRAYARSMAGQPEQALADIQYALTLPISNARREQLTQWAAALQAWSMMTRE
ncbi:MAG: hypothetical protein AAFV53_37670, partial [Myxococcota bacterium]